MFKNSKIFAIVACLFILLNSTGCKKTDETQSSVSGTTNTAKASTAAKTTSKSTAGTVAKSGTVNSSASTAGSNASADRKEDGNTNPSKENSNGDSHVSEEEKEETPEHKPVDEVIDLGGRKIIIDSETTSTIPIAGKSYRDDVILNNIKEAEEKYNCKIEIRSSAAGAQFYTNMINSVMAGLYFADIARVQVVNVVPKYINNNIILPLDEYLDFNSDLISRVTQQGSLWKGKYYGFRESAPGFSYFMLYNKDIFSREGLPDAFELQQRDEWTWENFLDIAQRATKDTDGDGIIDQWGVDDLKSSTNVLWHILTSNNADFVREENGTTVYGLDTPEAIQALQFWSDLINVYKVFPQTSATGNLYYQGKASMAFVNIWAYKKDQLPAGSGLILYPKGPSASSYNLVTGGTWFAIPSTTKDPEVVARIMVDVLCTWDETKSMHLDPMEAAMQNIQALVFRSEDFETYRLAMQNPIYMKSQAYSNIYPLQTEIFNRVVNGNEPMATVLDSIKPRGQAIIGEYENAKF